VERNKQETDVKNQDSGSGFWWCDLFRMFGVNGREGKEREAIPRTMRLFLNIS